MSSNTGWETIAPRYVAGIDLGTTNSALCYVDTEESPWRIRVFRIPQLVGPGQIEALEVLPSFHYEPAQGEFDRRLLRLPFGPTDATYVVGAFARDHGAQVPGRLVASAKSWLCHGGVDRTAPLLPWRGAADATKFSPVEISSRYLLHMRQAWDAQFPGFPLAEQEIVLTIPASFDEVARQLTLKAASLAGLRRVTLIEEPQAAFYAWIYRHQDGWSALVQPHQKILVCDIGGGTTDFTLICVRQNKDGSLQFHRVAVGDHLILGGDNLDLALAHHIEKKLGEEGALDPQSWSVLVRRCQFLKETLLAESAPDQVTVALPGRGSRLIAGTRTVELTRQEVYELLVEGFFPFVKLTDRPVTTRSGFQEFGLPYAPDPAVTRYLAAFLTAHRHVVREFSGEPTTSDPARPDLVLFNGGVFFSQAIKRRMVDVLSRWFSGPGETWQPVVLENDRLDLAVAQGAAYYGMVKRGQGVRIAAGLARTYYLGVSVPQAQLAELAMQAKSARPGSQSADRGSEGIAETSSESAEPMPEMGLGPAVCVLPAGMEPGEEIHVADRTFHLRVGEPVEFPVYHSGTRLTDKPGDLILLQPEDASVLPAVRTILRAGSRRQAAKDLEVTLHGLLTEIGTLELWFAECHGSGRWRLEFDVRSAIESDRSPHSGLAEREGYLEEDLAEKALALIDAAFQSQGREALSGLFKKMTDVLQLGRKDWPTSFLRRIWQKLMEHETARQCSAEHESRWLNMAGYALRPGFGLAADDWRVAETWRTLHGKLYHATPACRAEWWVLWRRIAGGLSAGQQQALATPLIASLRSLHKQQVQGTGSADFPSAGHEGAEILRLLGALELLPGHWKVELGNMIVDLLPKKRLAHLFAAMVWALGRLGARVPVYGPLNCVLPEDVVANWLERLLRLSQTCELSPFVFMQLARKTGDRYRDIPQKIRQRVVTWLQERSVAPHLIQLVTEGGALETSEQAQVFGEDLPRGLRIV